jgi:hypothetical protein
VVPAKKKKKEKKETGKKQKVDETGFPPGTRT